MRWRSSGRCVCFSVAQTELYLLFSVWYCGRFNRCNRRKCHCKALCAVLRRWRYNCIDGTKRTVNACMWLYCNRAKEKPHTFSRCKAKEKPRQRGRGVIVTGKLNFMFVKKCLHFVVVVFCQLVAPLIIRDVICDTGEVFFLVACKIKILIAF